jgi:hypothetical protein
MHLHEYEPIQRLHVVLRLRMDGAIPPLPHELCLHGIILSTGRSFTFTFYQRLVKSEMFLKIRSRDSSVSAVTRFRAGRTSDWDSIPGRGNVQTSTRAHKNSYLSLVIKRPEGEITTHLHPFSGVKIA